MFLLPNKCPHSVGKKPVLTMAHLQEHICVFVCVCVYVRVSGRGGAHRRESAISWTSLSSSCGQSSDERSRDMAGLNKHRATHAFDPGLTRGISH